MALSLLRQTFCKISKSRYCWNWSSTCLLIDLLFNQIPLILLFPLHTVPHCSDPALKLWGVLRQYIPNKVRYPISLSYVIEYVTLLPMTLPFSKTTRKRKPFARYTAILLQPWTYVRKLITGQTVLSLHLLKTKTWDLCLFLLIFSQMFVFILNRKCHPIC